MKKLIALCLLLPTALMSEPSKEKTSHQHPCCESSKAMKVLKAGGVIALGGSLLALGLAADRLIKQNDHIIWQNDTNRKSLLKVHGLSEAMVMHSDIIYDKRNGNGIIQENKRIIRNFERLKADLVQAYGQYPEGSSMQKNTKEELRKVERSILALREALEE